MAARIVTLEDVHKLQCQGVKENDPKKIEEAQRLFEHICAQSPDEWIPLFYLANTFLWQGRAGMAIPLLWRCHELSGGKQVEVYNNLGTAYRAEHKVDKAKEILGKGLELNPNDADALNNLGTLNINEGTPAEGIEVLERAIKAAPGHKQAHWNLALCNLELEHWKKGFEGYAWGVVTKDRMDKNYGGAPWWNDWKPHPHKTLAIYGEQGIGDEIMFFSMLPDVKRYFERIIVDCHPRLLGIFARSFPDMTFYPTRKMMDRDPDWVKDEKIDYKQSGGHLGAAFRHKEADFPKVPYLVPNRVLTDCYKSEIEALVGPGPYVVISWVGGHKKTRKDIRALSLDLFMPIIKHPGIKVISGQYTDHEKDVTEFCEKHDVLIHQFPEVFCSTRSERYYPLDDSGNRLKNHLGEDAWFQDKYEAKGYAKSRGYAGKTDFYHEKAYNFDHTFAFVNAVHELGGMVISVNNSLVHLCGAAGIRCHTLTPNKPAWRYGLTRKDMVWYSEDSVRQYRQKADGDWQEPINEALADAVKYLEQSK